MLVLLRCFAMLALLGACEGSSTKPGTFTSAVASSASPRLPTRHADDVAIGESVRIDTPPSVPPREKRPKARRVGDQVVIDSKGKWDRDCAIHSKKCKLKPTALPRCAADNPAELWSTTLAAKAEHFTDPHVSIRGRVWPSSGGFSSAVSCNNGRSPSAPVNCCNGTRVGVVLEGPPSDLELDGFGCAGDESRLCCNLLAEGQEVVATGELHYQSGRWWLSKTSLCSVTD